MGVQKLHAFEKTSVQLRHTMKRLEVFVDITKDESEKELALKLLHGVKDLRKLIPDEYQDTDLQEG